MTSHMTGYLVGLRGMVVALSAAAVVGCGGDYPLGRANDETAGEGGEAGGADGGKGGGVAGTGAGGTTGGSGGAAAGGAGGSLAGTGGTEEGGAAGDAGGEDAGGAPNAGSGGSGNAGSGGSAGTTVEGPPITRIRELPTEKIDLLFMVDNSLSMADKQQIMAEAVPVLLARLVTPRCIDEEGAPNGQVANALGDCASGSPEFPPVQDIHVGIITSSLGHHGSSDVCLDTANGRTPDDKAQLLGSVRSGIPSNSEGFLSWQPGQDPAELGMDFADQITSTGELGCGYESSLEAWYRFLVDPEPVASMDNAGNLSVRGAVNQTILAQRAAFLRPDSLLAIVMLTDENDCSILDENNTQGWLVGYKGGPSSNTWRMPASTASCQEDPNSACCRPCIATPAPGCPSSAEDGCTGTGFLIITDDSMNLRCFKQKERFGFSLLYPTERYVSALTDSFVDPRRDGNLVRNPIFAPVGDTPGRARDMVYLAGIVGVPWQDIATDDSVADGRKLQYLTARELADSDRWEVILGDPGTNTEPADPLMRESIDPRPAGAEHPLLDDAAIAPSSSTTLLNPINGHEQAVLPDSRDDLQFACIFPLAEPVACTAGNADGCDCNGNDYAKNSPLCQYSAPDTDGVQTHAKAYPGLRHLEVLKGIGDQALVASICPKNTTAAGDPVLDTNYGYNPAIDGILNRLREAINPTCIEEELASVSTDSGEQTLCVVMEAQRASSCECDEELGRIPLAENAPERLIAEAQLEADHQCGGTTGIDCDAFCLCEIRQLEGEALETCQGEVTPPEDANGFCFLDGENPDVNPTLLRTCPSHARRALRFTGEGTVTPGAFGLLACPED